MEGDGDAIGKDDVAGYAHGCFGRSMIRSEIYQWDDSIAAPPLPGRAKCHLDEHCRDEASVHLFVHWIRTWLRNRLLRVEKNKCTKGILLVRRILSEPPMVRRLAAFLDDEAVPHGDPMEHGERPPRFTEARLNQHRLGTLSDQAIRLATVQALAMCHPAVATVQAPATCHGQKLSRAGVHFSGVPPAFFLLSY